MLTTTRTWFNNLHINTQLMVLLTCLNIIDFQTTKTLVDRHGFEIEANPIMYNAMVMVNSVWGLMIIKVVTVGLMWMVYDAVTHHHRLINPNRMTRILTWLVVAFFILITWNFSLVTISLLS